MGEYKLGGKAIGKVKTQKNLDGRLQDDLSKEKYIRRFVGRICTMLASINVAFYHRMSEY